MTRPNSSKDSVWARHHAEWREPAQIVTQWGGAASVDPDSLRFKTQGAWWDVLESNQLTLLVTREYEHLVVALSVSNGRPRVTYLPIPHPSGLVVDRRRQRVHIASTRNPNQVYDLAPAAGMIPRLDSKKSASEHRPLVPTRSRFFPGCLYMHDLALIDGELHANAVGQNAVVKLGDDGFRNVWWPRCIEQKDGPLFGRNHLQLNSIAAGADLADSFFSASTDIISARRPGHRNFPVDKRGVIFSGKTREPVVRGLTRPHSARFHSGRLWVDNSGYGELGFTEDGVFVPVSRLPGWTRGLCFHKHVAFAGTSRVIPRFRHYAPGLTEEAAICGVHAVDTRSGKVMGSLLWPSGNQIFAIDWIPSLITSGLPFSFQKRKGGFSEEKELFYSYSTNHATKR